METKKAVNQVLGKGSRVNKRINYKKGWFLEGHWVGWDSTYILLGGLELVRREEEEKFFVSRVGHFNEWACIVLRGAEHFTGYRHDLPNVHLKIS